MHEIDKLTYDLMAQQFAKIPDITDMDIPYYFMMMINDDKSQPSCGFCARNCAPWVQRLIELGIMQAARLVRDGHSEWLPYIRAAAEAGAKPAGGDK